MFEVLHVPRVVHLDYRGCDRLRTVSKNKLSSLFCETPSSWGDRQNTHCSGFAKGSRFLNMVMPFVLYPLSHYNSITEFHAQFLLSLLEDISIDFPSHFILSLIDVYRDMVTCDKLIFRFAITRLLRHFSISFPKSPHFTTHIRDTCIVVTPDLIFKVLHVLRVAHPNYPSCDHLKTVSKDELSSLFCETPSS